MQCKRSQLRQFRLPSRLSEEKEEEDEEEKAQEDEEEEVYLDKACAHALDSIQLDGQAVV